MHITQCGLVWVIHFLITINIQNRNARLSLINVWTHTLTHTNHKSHLKLSGGRHGGSGGGSHYHGPSHGSSLSPAILAAIASPSSSHSSHGSQGYGYSSQGHSGLDSAAIVSAALSSGGKLKFFVDQHVSNYNRYQTHFLFWILCNLVISMHWNTYGHDIRWGEKMNRSSLLSNSRESKPQKWVFTQKIEFKKMDEFRRTTFILSPFQTFYIVDLRVRIQYHV